MNCFKCSASFVFVHQLIKHLRTDHILKDNDILRCNQSNCFRIYTNFNSLRKHLLSSHQSVQKHVKIRNFKEHKINSNVNLNFNEVPQINKCIVESNVSDDIPDLNQCPENYTKNCNEVLTQLDELKREVTLLVSEMYNNSLVPRKFVQFIVQNFENVILKRFASLIKNFVIDKLPNDFENLNVCNVLVHGLENCFSDVNSEYKCIKLYKESGTFVQSKDVIIGEKMQKVQENDVSVLKPVQVKLKMLSLTDLLTKLLKKDDVLLNMKDHLSNLQKEDVIIENFVQCTLWKSKIASYGNKIVFPLFLFFDDYEVGNALGAHAGTNKLGALYVNFPSMPPNLTSKLTNIFLLALFYSNDRKSFGNKIFSKLVDELEFLQTNGIKVNENETIYFKLGLVCGDNLGMHSILGFVESFTAHYACRFCKAHKSQLRKMTLQDDSLLRTPISYQADVAMNDLTKSGIKEDCIFNNLSGFHVTSNYAVDLMHDLLEGICNYDLTALLNVLIFDLNLFSLDTLNSKIQLFNYTEIEISNKPPVITLERIKSNIKMSSSEMLFFVRYLGVIIGGLVPEGLHIWNLWITLREIIEVVTAPSLHAKEWNRLRILIEEHNTLYLNYFGDLKPKFHYLLHYPLVLEHSGPLHHLWSMRAEQKHRESKLTANVSCSFKNMLQTLMFKAQLRIAHQLHSCPSNSTKYSPLSEKISVQVLQNYFPERNDIKDFVLTNWIDIRGTLYKPNFILILEWKSDYPLFGIIQHIVIEKINKIHFICKIIKTTGFNRHCYAFEVDLPKKENTSVYEVENLHSYLPCVLSCLGRKWFVTIRHAV